MGPYVVMLYSGCYSPGPSGF